MRLFHWNANTSINWICVNVHRKNNNGRVIRRALSRVPAQHCVICVRARARNNSVHYRTKWTLPCTQCLSTSQTQIGSKTDRNQCQNYISIKLLFSFPVLHSHRPSCKPISSRFFTLFVVPVFLFVNFVVLKLCLNYLFIAPVILMPYFVFSKFLFNLRLSLHSWLFKTISQIFRTNSPSVFCVLPVSYNRGLSSVSKYWLNRIIWNQLLSSFLAV